MKNREYWSRNKGRSIRGVVGVSLVVLVITVGFVWESYAREAFLYTDVLVMKEDTNPNTIITTEMLGVKKMDKLSLIEDPIQSPNSVIGKQALVFIPRGMELYDGLFLDQALASAVGEKIFSIPKEWLYAFPDTLRRGDTVYFYEISVEKSNNVLTQNSALEIEIGKAAAEPVISATVAYVKDSGNREVVDVVADRVDATSAVTKIEVVISEDRYNLLKDSFEAGNQFILMYRQGGSGE